MGKHWNFHAFKFYYYYLLCGSFIIRLNRILIQHSVYSECLCVCVSNMQYTTEIISDAFICEVLKFILMISVSHWRPKDIYLFHFVFCGMIFFSVQLLFLKLDCQLISEFSLKKIKASSPLFVFSLLLMLKCWISIRCLN